MGLVETYSRLRRSIVAFVPKVFPAESDGSEPQIPPIFGTGFVVHEDGIVATNHHVVEAFKKYPRPPGEEDSLFPVVALLFHRIDSGVAEVPLKVLGVGVIQSFEPGEFYYGPPKPDLALVHVKARGLPAVTIADSLQVSEGMTIATAGFPLGSELLTAPGWLHQLTPTLQQGIVSAVQPFEAPKPHGFSLNIMIQAGASGSPVFIPETGAVIGVVYASLGEPSRIWTQSEDGQMAPVGIVRLPTAISHAVPAHYLMHFLNDANSRTDFLPPKDAETIDRMIAGANLVSRFSGDAFYKPIYHDDAEPRIAIRQTSADK